MEQSSPELGVKRRTVLRAVAWSTPVIALSVAAPASSASVPILRVVGPWVIAPYPGSLNNFALDFNGGLTTFDASQIFASDDPDETWPDEFQLSWTATSTASVPDDQAFTSNFNVQSVTVANAAWGFESQCSITVTAFPYSGAPPVSTRIDFIVTAGD